MQPLFWRTNVMSMPINHIIMKRMQIGLSLVPFSSSRLASKMPTLKYVYLLQLNQDFMYNFPQLLSVINSVNKLFPLLAISHCISQLLLILYLNLRFQ